MTLLELAVQDADGIRIGERAGADRLELGAALSLGGVTPSAGLIELATAGPVPVHVLIRPRAGDFAYSPAERLVILRDVARAVEWGASGVVVGGTTGDGVDRDLIRDVRAAADGGDVTFHRAFDAIADRFGALEALIDLGVSRVLTSGGQACAANAVDELERLVEHGAGRIEVMAGGGVTAQNVAAVAATGVDAVHASAKKTVAGSPVPLGSADSSVRESTDEAHVRRLRAALDHAAA